ncbi:MAG: hypothetical protein QM790_11120 [Nibricoccus sp.]
MKTVVCTLFEGHYHIGAAALINSLDRAGFRGRVAAGFRGSLPPWANGKTELALPSGLVVHLISLTTTYHLTNFKPDFALSQLQQDDEAIWYLDPDIVVTARWRFFEEWATAGIALCEDVNSPLSLQHPRRVSWRNYFAQKGFQLRPRETVYVNGGCVGLLAANSGFLKTWRDLQLAMADAIGGLEQSKLNGGSSEQMRDPNFFFNASDQDALNATIEASPADVHLSILGSSAMGFTPGAAQLPHALGAPKPWKKAYLRATLAGHPPTTADKAFWEFTGGPLRPFTGADIRFRKRMLKIAAFVGRFYRRA